MTSLTEPRLRPLITPPDANAELIAVRDFILSLARDFTAGLIDHWAIRQQSIGRDRHVATMLTPRDHPDWPALMTMLDRLIASDPTAESGWQYATRQGTFGAREVEQAGGQIIKFTVPDGRTLLVIRFPFRKTMFDEPVYRHLDGYDPEHGRMADTPDAAPLPPLLGPGTTT